MQYMEINAIYFSIDYLNYRFGRYTKYEKHFV